MRPSPVAATSILCTISRSWLEPMKCSRRSLDPLDRAAQHARREGDEQLLWVDQEDLHAEAAAHVRRDHGDGGLRQPEFFGDYAAGCHRRLGRVPDGEVAEARIEAGDDAAGLHRLGRAAFGPELLAQREIGGGEGALEIAGVVGGTAGDVRIRVVVDERRAGLRCRHEIDRCWLGRVIHLDQVERVLGEVAALRDDQRHRLADEAHLGPARAPDGCAGG